MSRHTQSCKINIQAQIEALKDFSREELLQKWIKLHKTPPLKGARNNTLIRGIAYQMQAKTEADLKPSISRKLLKIANGGLIVQEKLAANTKLQPGTKLVREWNGRPYEVDVLECGFQMNGLTYPSLSAIAKAITGAHWSGPRFFGI